MAEKRDDPDTALVDRPPVGWATWLQWVVASAVGAAVVACLGVLVTLALSYIPGGNFVGLAVGMILGGVPIGLTQWLVLRRHVPRAGWWVLASAVGLALGVAVPRGFFAVEDVGVVVFMVLGLAVSGAITGGPLVWLLKQMAPR